MTAMDAILNEFGGVRPLARALGRSETPSTVQYWKAQNRLPRTACAEVMGALVQRGISARRARKLVADAVLGASLHAGETTP